MFELARPESTSGIGQLERPQEVVRLFEVRSNGEDLVDQVLHADNTILSKTLLNELVVGERNALLVDFAVASLVDELTDRFEVGITVSNERVDDREHFLRGSCQTYKHAIVELKEAEELHNLARLWGDLVNATMCECRPPLDLKRVLTL